MSLSFEEFADVDMDDLAQLHADGATLADAVCLWCEISNPWEMIGEKRGGPDDK